MPSAPAAWPAAWHCKVVIGMKGYAARGTPLGEGREQSCHAGILATDVPIATTRISRPAVGARQTWSSRSVRPKAGPPRRWVGPNLPTGLV